MEKGGKNSHWLTNTLSLVPENTHTNEFSEQENKVGWVEGGLGWKEKCVYIRGWKIHKNYLNSIGFIFYRRKFMMKRRYI